METIENYKPYLFTVAYNLTGEIATAEDLVQTAFEKWLKNTPSHVNNTKAYLSKIILSEFLKNAEKQKKEREAYKGYWLPEPIIQTTEESPKEELLDVAILFLLEQLNPYERAVLVLREAFDYSYEEISELIDITETNCRQLLHRAKEKVRKPIKSAKSNIEKEKELLNAFLLALDKNDLEKLESILKKDVEFYADGGGKMATALKPLFGWSKVVRFFVGVTKLQKDNFASLRSDEVLLNGNIGSIIYNNENVDSLMWVEVENDKISTIHSIRNPDKIKLNFSVTR